jgi:hypothetical protein
MPQNNQQRIQQQKILLLPPMKGLNLYDNPFTMDPMFAVDLVNFMPPTTRLEVRPGIQKIVEMYGAIRGIYSYAVGATKSYGEHWYDQTISEGERQILLLKFAENEGSSSVYSFNPVSGDSDKIASINDSHYSKDYTCYKHYIYICTGSPSSPMYLWGSRTGWSKMKWKNGDKHEMTDLENITFYNGYLFANSYNTFDIYCMKQTDADPTRTDKNWWDALFAWFTPDTNKTDQLTLDGLAIKGGSILKIFTICRTGSDTINDYLCICTNMGEIIVWEGTDPTKPDTWKVVGRYDIPIPLNKNCFCKMEGDVIVATKNGLYSLNRVIFGQSTQVTESLEYRIKNIFTDYMFSIVPFNKYIGLYYYSKNRLLIFNVPTQMPIPLNMITRGYTFTPNQRIMFPKIVEENSDELISQMCSFIATYLLKNWINYTLFLKFESNTGTLNEGITLDFATTKEPLGTFLNRTKTTVSFKISAGTDYNKSFLNRDLIFYCNDFVAENPIVTLDPTTPFMWNPLFYTGYENLSYYSYPFPQDDPNAEWKVVDIVPSTKTFALLTLPSSLEEITVDLPATTLYFLVAGEVLYDDTFNNDELSEDYSLYYNEMFLALLDALDKVVPETFDPNNMFDQIQLTNKYSFWNTKRKNPIYEALFELLSRTPDEMFINFSMDWELKYTFLHSTTQEKWYITFTFSVNVELDMLDLPIIYLDATLIASHGTKEYPLTSIRVGDDVINGKMFSLMFHMNWGKLSFAGIYKNSFTKIYKQNTEPQVNTSFSLDFTDPAWKISEVTANRISTDPLDYHWDKVFPKIGSITQATLPDLKSCYGWLVSLLGFQLRPLDLSPSPQRTPRNKLAKTEERAEKEKTDENLIPVDMKTFEKLRKLGQLPISLFSIQNSNFDLSLVPIFSGINILAPFRSTQYVMDSYYGTWSQWADVNLMDGIVHLDEFYFVVPKDYTPIVGTGGFIYNTSMLCKFNPTQRGDFADVLHPSDTQAINITYKTATTNFNVNQIKQISKIKLYGTASTFWGTFANQLQITMFSDFYENPTYWYQHGTQDGSIERILKLPKDFDLSKLTYQQLNEYKKLYLDESSNIRNVELSLICKPANRVALQMKMEIKEFNVVIYGYELYFKILNKL